MIEPMKLLALGGSVSPAAVITAVILAAAVLCLLISLRIWRKNKLKQITRTQIKKEEKSKNSHED